MFYIVSRLVASAILFLQYCFGSLALQNVRSGTKLKIQTIQLPYKNHTSHKKLQKSMMIRLKTEIKLLMILELNYK